MGKRVNDSDCDCVCCAFDLMLDVSIFLDLPLEIVSQIPVPASRKHPMVFASAMEDYATVDDRSPHWN